MTTHHTYLFKSVIFALTALVLVACSGMNQTQQRTLSGAGIGAGVGAIGSAVTGGSAIGGAAIGAAVGGAGGYIYDKNKK